MMAKSLETKCHSLALVLLLLMPGYTTRGLAYAESYAPPEELIKRSDFIVVGHVIGNTFPRVEKDSSEDYSTTLVITEILKGDIAKGQSPIVIRYDLKPSEWGEPETKKPIILVGGGMHGPVSGDIRQDRIWFLRKGDPKDTKGNDSIGISRGQDTEDLELKPYYVAFMSPDPESVLRQYVNGESRLAQLSRSFVNAKDIGRICQIVDVNERVDKLLPYYLNGQDSNGMATREIILSGEVGIRKLVPIYQQSEDEMRKIGIITTLTQMGYRDADPLLASMLEKEDQFWARQYVRANTWWTAEDPDPSSDQARNVSKARMDAILAALRGTHDPHAIEVINSVNKRWQNWQGYILSDPDPYP